MKTKPKFTPNRDLKLMDQVREVLRYHHYAFTTEITYCKWILKYIRYFGVNRHPQEMGATEVETFLSHLATSKGFRQLPSARHSTPLSFSKMASICEKTSSLYLRQTQTIAQLRPS